MIIRAREFAKFLKFADTQYVVSGKYSTICGTCISLISHYILHNFHDFPVKFQLRNQIISARPSLINDSHRDGKVFNSDNFIIMNQTKNRLHKQDIGNKVEHKFCLLSTFKKENLLTSSTCRLPSYGLLTTDSVHILIIFEGCKDFKI